MDCVRYRNPYPTRNSISLVIVEECVEFSSYKRSVCAWDLVWQDLTLCPTQTLTLSSTKYLHACLLQTTIFHSNHWHILLACSIWYLEEHFFCYFFKYLKIWIYFGLQELPWYNAMFNTYDNKLLCISFVMIFRSWVKPTNILGKIYHLFREKNSSIMYNFVCFVAIVLPQLSCHDNSEGLCVWLLGKPNSLQGNFRMVNAKMVGVCGFFILAATG